MVPVWRSAPLHAADGHAPTPMSSTESSAAGSGMDTDLFRILTKAVEELGLEWSPPEEPSRGRLDKWFLPGSSSKIFAVFPGGPRRDH
ncbi:hypothetical protein Q8A67_023498 [Cirrhinus molitorella]|uniref:Uncharacterized protein n=1 Tax=Cirrhinus molitorella TaxID=172907 RepID=A0AA88P003_9TELE|nr:hypothetical protein Q8A67_023498 [Cirrhinus molitorella]